MAGRSSTVFAAASWDCLDLGTLANALGPSTAGNPAGVFLDLVGWGVPVGKLIVGLVPSGTTQRLAPCETRLAIVAI